MTNSFQLWMASQDTYVKVAIIRVAPLEPLSGAHLRIRIFSQTPVSLCSCQFATMKRTASLFLILASSDFHTPVACRNSGSPYPPFSWYPPIIICKSATIYEGPNIHLSVAANGFGCPMLRILIEIRVIPLLYLIKKDQAILQNELYFQALHWGYRPCLSTSFCLSEYCYNT